MPMILHQYRLLIFAYDPRANYHYFLEQVINPTVPLNSPHPHFANDPKRPPQPSAQRPYKPQQSPVYQAYQIQTAPHPARSLSK